MAGAEDCVQYRLIVSDVDGCLAPEESAAWDFPAFASLADRVRALQDTTSFTLCTGRPQPYVEVLMKLLDVRIPAICESGAVLYSLKDNRSIYGPGVTEEKLDELFEIRHFITSDLLKRYPLAVHQFGKEAQISLFSADPARIPELADEVRRFADRYRDDPVEVSASHYYLNVSLRGVTKGSAVRQLMSETGASRSQVAAIGDTVGDLPLADEAAFFACPANSTPEVQAAADYVSPHRDVHGLLDILDRLGS